MKTLLKSFVIALILFGMNIWANAEFNDRPADPKNAAVGEAPNENVEIISGVKVETDKDKKTHLKNQDDIVEMAPGEYYKNTEAGWVSANGEGGDCNACMPHAADVPINGNTAAPPVNAPTKASGERARN